MIFSALCCYTAIWIRFTRLIFYADVKVGGYAQDFLLSPLIILAGWFFCWIAVPWLTIASFVITSSQQKIFFPVKLAVVIFLASILALGMIFIDKHMESHVSPETRYKWGRETYREDVDLYREKSHRALSVISVFDYAIKNSDDKAGAYFKRGKEYTYLSSLHDPLNDKTYLHKAISDFSDALAYAPPDFNCAPVYQERGDTYLHLAALNDESSQKYSQANLEAAVADYDRVVELYVNAQAYNQSAAGGHLPLIYKQRAYAHYLLKNYDQAWRDVYLSGGSVFFIKGLQRDSKREK